LRQHLLLDLRQTCSRAASWISICLLLKLCCSHSHRRPPAPEAHLKPQTGARGSSSYRRPPMLPQAYKCSRPSYCHRLNQAKLLPQAHPGQAAATGATRRKQTAASRGGSTTNAAGSSSRPMVSAVGGASLLVKNDGTASEHVLTALVYYGRSAGVSIWASPLFGRRDRAPALGGTGYMHNDVGLRNAWWNGRDLTKARRFRQKAWWSSAPHTPMLTRRCLPWLSSGKEEVAVFSRH